jgi:voltage-gated potassium channel
VKHRVYELLEREPAPSPGARRVRAVILALILVSALGLVLESVAGIRAAAAPAFRILEIVTVTIFSAEYLVRLWAITENPRYAHPIKGRLRWAVSPLALLDLLAVLPFYLPFITADTRVLRLVRIFRLARIAKFGRYNRAAGMLAAAVRERREELTVSGVFIAMLLVISSSLMFYAENEAQPEVFSSIPASMWWAIVTLTTVGYGDTYPVTSIGRVLAAVTAILGIAMLALPTAILTSGFMERLRKPVSGERCPHCGGELQGP